MDPWYRWNVGSELTDETAGLHGTKIDDSYSEPMINLQGSRRESPVYISPSSGVSALRPLSSLLSLGFSTSTSYLAR